MFAVRTGETDVFVSTLSTPKTDARRASARYPGRNVSPAWSPMGRMLAYLSRGGSETFGEESRAIVIASIDSGDERELLPALAHMERVQWSPDSAFLRSAAA